MPPADPEAAEFVAALKNALPGRDITVIDAKLTTLLFEVRKYDLVHFFIRPDGKSSQLAKKFSGKIQAVQTLLDRPSKPADLQKLLFGETVVVFSNATKQLLESNTPGSKARVIPPCVHLPDVTQLAAGSEIRERYQVGDRVLVVALNDLLNQKEFDSFLYIAREYNRRDVFRFLIPVYEKTKAADSWRAKLQYSIDMEKLDAVTILKGGEDLHSLIDASDWTVSITRNREGEDGTLEFPLRGLEALLRGKPLLCFAQSPISEIVRQFKSNWVTKNTEDFIRESRDIQKEEKRLEEISTELARFARSQFDPAVVAAAYEDIYNRLMPKSAELNAE